MGFRTRRLVEFRDTDAAGIVHFSAFFPWMEAAEHAMLRSLDIPVLPQNHGVGADRDAAEGGSSGSKEPVTWPRVSASCDYASAARFEDELDIEVTVAKIGRASICYAIAFSRQNVDGSAVPIAKGTTVAVCCKLLPGGGLEKVPVPDAIREKLKPFATVS